MSMKSWVRHLHKDIQRGLRFLEGLVLCWIASVGVLALPGSAQLDWQLPGTVSYVTMLVRQGHPPTNSRIKTWECRQASREDGASWVILSFVSVCTPPTLNLSSLFQPNSRNISRHLVFDKVSGFWKGKCLLQECDALSSFSDFLSVGGEVLSFFYVALSWTGYWILPNSSSRRICLLKR